MFERYTEKARRVIFLARYEASNYGSPYIETEHLLLGLIRETSDLMYSLLPSPTSISKIRKQIDDQAVQGAKTSTSVDLPLSNECKRVLEYAGEEAERLSHKHIGSEHLLLGLLREKGGLGARLLNSQGVSLARVREFVGKRPRSAADVVEIHGEDWPISYVRGKLEELGEFAWRLYPWQPSDIVVETSSDSISFDTTLKEDPAFKFVAGGCSRDYCSICNWELTIDGESEHSTGYSNGRIWLCTECYQKFFVLPVEPAKP